MASIRKRGNSYLLVVSMGYDPEGHRRKPQQKTVHPPEGLTPKAKEKWLEEEAALFERECKNEPLPVDKSITWRSTPPTGLVTSPLESWRNPPWPGTSRTSTVPARPGQLQAHRPKAGHFRNLYAQLRKQKNSVTGKPLSESTIEGVHACLCGILSDAMEGGFLATNPAWRTYKYAGKKKKKRNVADEEPPGKLIAALEEESIKYETYFKLIIATGMRPWGNAAA